MSINRVSNSFLIDQGVFQLQYSKDLIGKLQKQVSSGRRFDYVSEDLPAGHRLLNATRNLEQDDRYNKNTDQARSELKVTESSMDAISDVLNRARELATNGANATNGVQERDAIRREIDSLIEQLVQLGNTTHQGKYVYSGFLTSTPSFTVTGQNVTYNGPPATPVGNWQRQVQVDTSTQVAVNVHGRNLLGSVYVSLGVPYGGGVFYALRKLSLDLQNGNFTAISADLPLIDTEQQNLLNHLTTIATRQNQLDLNQNRIADRKLSFSEEISNLQQVDLPSVISKMTYQQNIYQASASSLGRILDLSLVNFLR